MTAGLRRGTTEYLWPTELVRPDDLRLVYLDLNHWISLAKAAVGHADGARYAAALEALRAAKGSGLFAFPLSSTHFMEVAPAKNPRHRGDVADVMEELSEFDVLVSRSVIQEMEIDAALDVYGRPLGLPYPRVPLLGRGVMRAFGRVGGLKVWDGEGADVTARVRAGWPGGGPAAFDRWREDAERELDRRILRGPATPEEETALRADGWDPIVARRMMTDNANVERELARWLSTQPHWRTQRVRDVVSARHLFLELNEKLAERLAMRGIELEELFPARGTARGFVDAMPSSDVIVSLKAAAHRNPQTDWTPNRLFDMDALAVAVPYCDFVATDREAAHALRSERIPDRLGTTVVATLDDLVDAMTSG